MKTIILFAAFLFLFKTMWSQINAPSFAANQQDVKNKIGKNISEGKERYDGINTVFTIKLSGLKEPEHFKLFDEEIMKNEHGKILSSSGNFSNGITTITVEGNSEISDIKDLIYAQGKIIVPHSKFEILEYRKDYYVEDGRQKTEDRRPETEDRR